MTKCEKGKILIVIFCISFLQGLQFSLTPVLDKIAAFYGEKEVSSVQMLVTAPALVAVLFSFLTGWLVLKIRKKSLLLFGSLLAGCMGLVPLLYDSFSLLFCTRVLYGICQGLATTLNTAVVADYFEGDERVSVMGIQGASIGIGMVCITTISGWIGSANFRNAYWINLIGFIAFILIMLCMPEQEKSERQNGHTLHLTKEVYIASLFGFLEFIFLTAFSTNIALHIQGPMTGNSKVTGTLLGIFSGVQIVAGLILRRVTHITGKMTMPLAMISFSLGAIMLYLFPSVPVFLAVSSMLCGISQGFFAPTGMVTVSNAVMPEATAMASAVFTGCMSLGQFLSPVCLNTAAKCITGQVGTGSVFIIAAVGMCISAVFAAIWKIRFTPGNNG